jgi:hypothetical protein
VCLQEATERERPAGRIVSGNIHDRLRSLRQEKHSSRVKGSLAAAAKLRGKDNSIVVVGGGVAQAQQRR